MDEAEVARRAAALPEQYADRIPQRQLTACVRSREEASGAI